MLDIFLRQDEFRHPEPLLHPYQRGFGGAIVAVRAEGRGDDDLKSASPLAKRNHRNEPPCYPCRDQSACREMAVLFQHHRVWPSAVEARHPRRRARRPKALGIAIPDKLLALADEVIE